MGERCRLAIRIVDEAAGQRVGAHHAVDLLGRALELVVAGEGDRCRQLPAADSDLRSAVFTGHPPGGVPGRPGVLASGQVVGVIDDLPTCEELLDRVVTKAADCLRRTSHLLC